ncbi:hypothetical protein HQ865_05820 [Mucilaginibacter mali]|uniref:Uncharacterized protein n=1 Tax=Mucilaginibacter mali TaxID=2740462 RepID=A0A7D4Q6J8_9SPHI|nr:hypothetical protein [Mucilaginibacter mali]QKJ29291.1 hypothetical protein HQ865_05820 [Mucilaginibacter mali]
MKNTLILSALVLLLTSCSKYQINVLSSNNIKKDPDNGKFVTENDSVKITYSFFGRNAPINLDVYNKLNEPLYIDWQRSAFITGDKAVSYASDKVYITGDVSGTSIGNKSVSYSSGSIDAVATLPKSVVFIPPHTHVNNTLLEVTSQFVTYIPDNKFTKKEIPSLSISGTSLVNIAEFGTDQSPLNFRSYLSLYVMDNNVPKYMAYEHNFFVSKLINTSEEPANFEFSQVRRGDYFYTSKATAGGQVATGVGIAAVVVGVAALDAKHPETAK